MKASTSQSTPKPKPQTKSATKKRGSQKKAAAPKLKQPNRADLAAIKRRVFEMCEKTDEIVHVLQEAAINSMDYAYGTVEDADYLAFAHAGLQSVLLQAIPKIAKGMVTRKTVNEWLAECGQPPQ